ncbi:MAG: hypothetical protein AB7E78_05055 [Porticoccaceae bacterium]
MGAARGQVTYRNERAQYIATPPVEKLLPRLDKVKKTAPGKWLALCPAHADSRPSLNVRELEDGTLLLKCWSGCGAADVVEAVGLRLHDLFPRKLENRRALRPGERWTPRDALGGVAFEALVVAIAGEQLMQGNPLTRRDLDRVAQAAGLLRAAAAEVGCGN